jgi:hypothetical protein
VAQETTVVADVAGVEIVLESYLRELPDFRILNTNPISIECIPVTIFT